MSLCKMYIENQNNEMVNREHILDHIFVINKYARGLKIPYELLEVYIFITLN